LRDLNIVVLLMGLPFFGDRCVRSNSSFGSSNLTTTTVLERCYLTCVFWCLRVLLGSVLLRRHVVGLLMLTTAFACLLSKTSRRECAGSVSDERSVARLRRGSRGTQRECAGPCLIEAQAPCANHAERSASAQVRV